MVLCEDFNVCLCVSRKVIADFMLDVGRYVVDFRIHLNDFNDLLTINLTLSL